VYEFTSSRLGAQDALGGGGRYDRLVSDLGGPELPAVGFAAGIERIVMLMEPAAPDGATDFFIVKIGPEMNAGAFALLTRLRRRGLSGDMDYEGRKIKGQMRAANAAGARFVVILGPDEAARGRVRLKAMADGTEAEVSPDEAAERISGGRR
jgi:histidyl-tRNA synthetase